MSSVSAGKIDDFPSLNEIEGVMLFFGTGESTIYDFPSAKENIMHSIPHTHLITMITSEDCHGNWHAKLAVPIIMFRTFLRKVLFKFKYLSN